MHENRGKPIFCPMEWCIGNYPGMCKVFIKTSKCYLMLMFYHADILVVFHFYAQTVLWGL